MDTKIRLCSNKREVGGWSKDREQTFRYHGREEKTGCRYTVPHEVAHITIHFDPKKDESHHREKRTSKKDKKGHTRAWYMEYKNHLKIVETKFFDEIEEQFKKYRQLQEKEAGKVWFTIQNPNLVSKLNNYRKNPEYYKAYSKRRYQLQKQVLLSKGRVEKI